MSSEIDLLSVFDTFSKIGQKNGTGLERLALSQADLEGRRLFSTLLRNHRLHVYHDAIGNQFGLVKPIENDAPIVLVGSHLDSQPDGGRFDGQVGVLAAFSAVCKLRDSTKIPARLNLGVVNWTNEEGARFQPSVMGSSYFTNRLTLDSALDARDIHGVTVGEELHRLKLTPTHDLRGRVVGYAELHVEQGAILEREGTQLGIVDGTWAAYKADLRARGVQTHTGPTPMAQRVDALYAVSRAIVAVHDLGMRETSGELHTAVAWMNVMPNSPNATPSHVDFKVELRSPREELLHKVRDELRDTLTAITAESSVEFEIGDWSERRAESFNTRLVAEVEASVQHTGLTTRRMKTIAGHDAVVMNAAGIPTTLLFIPSHGGITHNAAEFTADTDLINGEQALAQAILTVCEHASHDF